MNAQSRTQVQPRPRTMIEISRPAFGQAIELLRDLFSECEALRDHTKTLEEANRIFYERYRKDQDLLQDFAEAAVSCGWIRSECLSGFISDIRATLENQI